MSQSSSVFTSAEVWLVGLIGVAVVAGGLLVFSLDRSWQMLDLRDWTFVSSPPVEQDFFHRLQTGHTGRRAFEVTVQLPRIPRRGDFAAAETVVEVDDSRIYCFRGFVRNDFFRPRSQVAAAALEVRLTANDRSAGFPLSRHEDPVDLVLDGIRPRKGAIHLRFEVRAGADQEQASWQKASLTRLDFVELQPCEASR